MITFNKLIKNIWFNIKYIGFCILHPEFIFPKYYYEDDGSKKIFDNDYSDNDTNDNDTNDNDTNDNDTNDNDTNDNDTNNYNNNNNYDNNNNV